MEQFYTFHNNTLTRFAPYIYRTGTRLSDLVALDWFAVVLPCTCPCSIDTDLYTCFIRQLSSAYKIAQTAREWTANLMAK
jgi:hypothetical protein